MEPDIPFVEGEIELLFAALLSLNVITDGRDRADEAVHVDGFGKEVGRVVVHIAIIGVQREIIDLFIGVVEHGGFPRTVGRHLGVGATGHYQFDGRVHPLHHLGGFDGETAIFVGGLGAGLPRTVHLVAETPDFDVMRVGIAVGAAAVAPQRAAGEVAVFEQVARGLRAPPAQVVRPHGRGVVYQEQRRA